MFAAMWQMNYPRSTRQALTKAYYITQLRRCKYIIYYTLNPASAFTMTLHLLHININGLRNKKQQLIEYINEHNIDIVGINETKLNNNTRLTFPNYLIIRRDRNNHGGGVAMMVIRKI